MRTLPALLLALAVLAPAPAAAAGRDGGKAVRAMVRLPAGAYVPLYGRRGDPATRVASFRLDRDPVTRGDFLRFVRESPAWRRDRVAAVHADRARYLAGWPAALDAGDA